MTDTYSLITEAKKGDRQAEKKLIDDNLPLVHSLAKRLMRTGCEYEDLVQVGSIGLLKAIRRFDISLNLKLSTYAVPLITGEIKRYIRDNSALKVSRSLREIWIKALKAQEILKSKLFRDPTVTEIASFLGESVEKLTLAMEASSPCESIYKNLAGDGNDEFFIQDTLKSDSDTETEIEKIALKDALSNLEQREKKIIILRYFRGKTQAEVSQIIGVSQVQISRIEKKVLATLRNNMQ